MQFSKACNTPELLHRLQFMVAGLDASLAQLSGSFTSFSIVLVVAENRDVEGLYTCMHK
jgi:hypothetical protein